MDILKGISDIDVLTAIKNASGTRPSLYVPQTAFEMLVKKQIQSFKVPSQNCVDSIHTELKEIVEESAKKSIKKYQHLSDAIIECTYKILNEYIQPTHVMVENLINIETAYINTNHPDFDTSTLYKEIDETMKMQPVEDQKQGQPPPKAPSQSKVQQAKSKDSYYGSYMTQKKRKTK